MPSYGPEQKVTVNGTPDGITTAGRECGIRVTFAVAGRITKIRYWRDAANTATANFKIYRYPEGQQIVTSPALSHTASGTGYQTYTLTTPVDVTAGWSLTVSYNFGTNPVTGQVPVRAATPNTVTNSTDCTWAGSPNFYYHPTAGTYPGFNLTTNAHYIEPIFEKEVTPGPTSKGLLKPYVDPVAGWTISSWRASTSFPAIAHRGAPNGHELGEFSLEGYIRAVQRGFGALEASCHRSSDGVWVLNHDATTGAQWNGTSLTIATTPWSTLQTLTRRYGNPVSQMYRADAFLTEYAQSGRNVILLENKAYTNFVEFEAMAAAVDPNKNQIIMKHGGEGTSNHQFFKDRGWLTWGYFFGDTGVSGAQNLPTKAAVLDWVGLSGGVSPNLPTAQTWWDWCKANNKPIIGHIGNVDADWTGMKAQGANMLMLNNPNMFPVT